MRIGVNLLDINPGKNGGMEVYVRSIVEYLQRVDKRNEYYLIGNKNVIDSFYCGSNCFKIPVENFLFHNIDIHKVVHNIIGTYQFNVWFSPMLALSPLDCPIPSAICIPDLQHKYYPEFFDKHTIQWRETYMKQSALKANVIFTLSNNSKRDIVNSFKVDPQKVIVTYLGLPSWIGKNGVKTDATFISKKFGIKNNYLFYPANMWPHKNHKNLILAFERIKNKTNLDLVFSGANQASSTEIRKLCDNLQLTKRVKILGYVSNDELPALYKSAFGLVFPSLFEGFGIPILEAFKMGCPVITGDNTSMKEVGGDAVLYFRSESVDSIEKSLLMFIEDKSLRARLIKKGYAQLNKFNYEKTARTTLKALSGIATEDFVSSDITIKKYPKISIITPTFNQAKYIERTIKSVFDQNYPNLEYIVVDGKSTDNTVEILKKYSNKIKWISEKDHGQTNAMNKGFRMATGDILAYLNSDDTYEKGTLLKIAKFFKSKSKTLIVYGKGKYIDENDNYIEDYPNNIVSLDSMFYECGICQPTVFFKRVLWEKVGEFDEKYHSVMDYDYWIRTLKVTKIKYINDYLANYRIQPDSKTVSQRQLTYKELIRASKRLFNKVSFNWIIGYFYVTKLNKPSIQGSKKIFALISSIFESFLMHIYLNFRPPGKIVFKIYKSWLKEVRDIFLRLVQLRAQSILTKLRIK